MASPSILTVTLHILAWICTLQQTLVVASTSLHLIHYSHSIRGGPNTTYLEDAGTPELNLTEGVKWGTLDVYDDMLRAGPSMNSTLLGRVTGTATGVVNPTTFGNGTRVQLINHHVFQDASKYNGSYINIFGILLLDGKQEVIVPGCTGALRGYSGYAITSQISETSGFDEEPPVYVVFKWDIYLTKP